MKHTIYFYKNHLNKEVGDKVRLRRDNGYNLFQLVKKKLEGHANIEKFLFDSPEVKRHLKDNGFPIILNWGVSSNKHAEDYLDGHLWLNSPDAVLTSVDKRLHLNELHKRGFNCVTPLTNEQAKNSFKAGRTIICRKTAKGTGGEGILVLRGKNDDDKEKYLDNFPECELYTQYFTKTHEYRVHVFNGEVIDVQQKRRMSEEKLQENGLEYDKLIRSYNNGWVFCRDNVELEEIIQQHCESALPALSLHFGAFDVLVRRNPEGKLIDYAICEVNSSPGLEGESLEIYSNAAVGLILQTIENFDINEFEFGVE